MNINSIEDLDSIITEINDRILYHNALESTFDVEQIKEFFKQASALNLDSEIERIEERSFIEGSEEGEEREKEYIMDQVNAAIDNFKTWKEENEGEEIICWLTFDAALKRLDDIY